MFSHKIVICFNFYFNLSFIAVILGIGSFLEEATRILMSQQFCLICDEVAKFSKSDQFWFNERNVGVCVRFLEEPEAINLRKVY